MTPPVDPRPARRAAGCPERVRRLNRRALWLLLPLALGLSSPADAPAASPTPPDAACNVRHGTALGQIACELVRGLPSTSPPVSVVLARPPRSSVRLLRPDELAARLASLVAGELGPNAVAVARSSWSSPNTPQLVLSIELEHEQLAVRADVPGPALRFWERMRGVVQSSRAHSFAARSPDAEVRTHLPPIPLVLSRLERARAPDEPVLALGCGDADADGNLELVALGRHRIQLGRLRAGRFAVFRSRTWNELSEVSGAPLREPLATVSLASPGTLEVGISDRQVALRLDGSLRPQARFPHQLPWPGGGCAHRAGPALGLRASCAERAPQSGALDRTRIDAVGGARLIRADGLPNAVYAERHSELGRLVLRVGKERLEVDEPIGAQLAVGDLNGDGTPELVTTRHTLVPDDDFLLVRSLGADGVLREVFRLAAPGGVRAVCVCPIHQASTATVVAAVGGELWALR